LFCRVTACGGWLTCCRLRDGLASTTYFLRVHWQLCTLIPWIGTTDFLLQIFLTWRIYAVSGKKWRVFPAVAMLFSIAGTVLPYYVAIWLRGQALVTALDEMKPLIWAWWALHAGVTL
jgi:hypothetical protein